MTEIENEKDKHQWWRWLFVPVAPPIAGLAGGVAFHLMQWFGMKMTGGYSEDGWIFLYFMPLITAGLVGCAYSWSAAIIAPSAQFKASLAMTSLLFLFALFALFACYVAIVRPEHSRFEAVSVVLMSVAAAVGSIIALHGSKKAFSSDP